MGMFDFVKNAGEKLFHPGEDRRETAIEQHLAANGITGITVEVDGDKAVLTGTAKDVPTREKAVLIAGNIEGIASVDDRIRVPLAAAAAAQQAKAPTATPAPNTGASTASTPPSPPSAAAATPTASEGWSSRTYTVKPGDTLSKIAQQVYGDASKYPRIFEANQPMLKDPDKIYPGQVLRIPTEH